MGKLWYHTVTTLVVIITTTGFVKMLKTQQQCYVLLNFELQLWLKGSINNLAIHGEMNVVQHQITTITSWLKRGL